MILKYIFKSKQKWFQMIRQSSGILLIAVIIGLAVNQLHPNKLPLVAIGTYALYPDAGCR